MLFNSSIYYYAPVALIPYVALDFMVIDSVQIMLNLQTFTDSVVANCHNATAFIQINHIITISEACIHIRHKLCD